MAATTRTRSTADTRRTEVLDKALAVFAATGYHATPTQAVADAAGISQGYVLRLFDGKLGLFVAVIEHCYDRIRGALAAGAANAAGEDPDQILEAMGDAYAALIADRTLIMIQVHAQSACDVPEIRDATRRGLESVVRFTAERTAADDAAIQRFIAYGQLCNLIVTADLDAVDAGWAAALTLGMRHPDAPGPGGDR